MTSMDIWDGKKSRNASKAPEKGPALAPVSSRCHHSLSTERIKAQKLASSQSMVSASEPRGLRVGRGHQPTTEGHEIGPGGFHQGAFLGVHL